MWRKNNELCEHITHFFWLEVKSARFFKAREKLTGLPLLPTE